MSENKKPTLNRAARRALAAQNRHRAKARKSGPLRGGNAPVSDRRQPTDHRQISPDVRVYTDDSYKNRAKIAYTSGMQQVKERIAAINARFRLPESITTACAPFSRCLSALQQRRGYYTSVMVINRDGHPRDFLPDKTGRHVILCHRSIARHLVSQCCMLVRIAANEDADGHNIDGSWAIVPAQYAMMRTTTIQHLRRRPFFFLHRYWYEISFDGRVQPAHMLFDYNINPLRRRTRFWVTHEYVPVRKRDETNDYFRFWRDKPNSITASAGSYGGKNRQKE